MSKAEQIYQTMVKTLEGSNWAFDEHPEELTIVSGYTGEDDPIDFLVHVDAENEIIMFFSSFDFVVPEDERIAFAVAVCVANYAILDGCFDFNFDEGTLQFRLTTSFCGCQVGMDFFVNMIATGVTTIDRYNDKFDGLANGKLSLQEFISSEEND